MNYLYSLLFIASCSLVAMEQTQEICNQKAAAFMGISDKEFAQRVVRYREADKKLSKVDKTTPSENLLAIFQARNAAIKKVLEGE